MRKRILALFLAVVMACAVLPTAYAAEAEYDPAAAVAYAEAHWNDGVGVCDQFVKACLKAGGVTINAGGCNAVFSALQDYGTACRLTLTGNYVYEAQNQGKIAAGDILFFYCNTCGAHVHTVICGGIDSAGRAYAYGHNSAWNRVTSFGTFYDAWRHTNFTLYCIHMDTPQPERIFSDVDDSAWYAPYVQVAYEHGLMIGMGDGSFAPEGQVTLAQSVVMACRIYNLFTGESFEAAGADPWYQPYMDYAAEKDLLPEAFDCSDMNQSATRAEVAAIFARALPDGALELVNEVSEGAIPDVSGEEPFAAAVYLLYRAGILNGMDNQGTFAPEGSFTRAQAATILVRLGDPDCRMTVQLG